MFTGIVERTGTVVDLGTQGDACRLMLRASFPERLSIGASLALNGACLTVTENSGEELGFDLLQETLHRTNLGDLRPGDLVNLERPLPVSGRFDGHIVQGHIDATGTVASLEALGADRRLAIGYPAAFARYLIPKGSIAINGISLTIAEVTGSEFAVWIIPQTWKVTNLAACRTGIRVNLEFDLIAKYIERLIAP